jgi:hypothetical protein
MVPSGKTRPRKSYFGFPPLVTKRETRSTSFGVCMSVDTARMSEPLEGASRRPPRAGRRSRAWPDEGNVPDVDEATWC